MGRTEDYFQTLVSAFEMRLAVGVLRIPGGHGLDVTKAGVVVPTLTASSTGSSRARKVSTDSDSAGPMDRSESKTSVDSGYEAVASSGRGGGPGSSHHHDHHLETVIDKIRAKFRHDSTTSPTDSEVSATTHHAIVGQELVRFVENSDVHQVRQCMEIFAN